MAKSSALDVFNSITIEEVREQIATIDAEIAVLEKKRDSLRTIEKAIDIRDNGKKPWGGKRKAKAAEKSAAAGSDGLHPDVDEADCAPAAARPATGPGPGRQPSPETVELRDRLHKILRLRGPMKIGDLTREFQLDYGKISNALTGPQFRKLDDGRYAVK